jgi:O-antigen ligase
VRAIRIGICLLAAFAVFAHGAVETWSQSILEIGAAALLLLWGILGFRGAQEIRWNPLLWPLLAFAALVLLQWATHLSVYPYLTKVELLQLAADLILFFLAVQVFRTLGERKGFVWFLLALGFAVSLFGILQHFTFNGKLYWVRELRYGGIPFGPYVNRNHFAGLVELLVPSGLAILVLRAIRPDQLPVVAVFTVVPIGALFLSASRGGITSFLTQLGLLSILIWRKGGLKKHLVAATVILLLGLAMVAWLGIGRALERFGTVKTLEVSESQRLVVVKDTWRIFLDHPLLGTGLGTFVAVYPRYESFSEAKVFLHAHNDYVEALAETGIVGALFGLFFVVLLFRLTLANLRSSRNSFHFALYVGPLVACTGLLVHSLTDFNLHIPSNALIFLLQSALATSAVSLVTDEQKVGSSVTFAKSVFDKPRLPI